MTRGRDLRVRSRSSRSSPFIRGIQTSSNSRSKRRWRSTLSASTPSFATVTVNPALVRTLRSTCRVIRSSSTTRMRLMIVGSSCARFWAAARGAAAIPSRAAGGRSDRRQRTRRPGARSPSTAGDTRVRPGRTDALAPSARARRRPRALERHRRLRSSLSGRAPPSAGPPRPLPPRRDSMRRKAVERSDRNSAMMRFSNRRSPAAQARAVRSSKMTAAESVSVVRRRIRSAGHQSPRRSR